VYEVTIETGFSGAHVLRGYKGKCGRLHGHNWKVQVTVAAERLDDVGMGLDFSRLKEETRAVLAQVDHSHLNEVFPFTELNPTAENIAKWVWEMLGKRLDSTALEVTKVTVWESESAAATFVP
jgi:6-pyruvoyltetrahydropterin/6-carboxytetrahydropterin synthase